MRTPRAWRDTAAAIALVLMATTFDWMKGKSLLVETAGRGILLQPDFDSLHTLAGRHAKNRRPNRLGLDYPTRPFTVAG